MRIEFLTDDNPLYVLPFFEEFLRHYASEFDITRVSSCRPMGKRSRGKLLAQLAFLYGPLGITRVIARWGTALMMGRLHRRPTAGRFYTLTQLCQSYRIPIARPASPNAPDFVKELRKRAPDLIVSVACPYILKEPVLSAPPLGCVNIHHASLPHYKGMMPTFWQMYHGESTVGVTIHYMAPTIDGGPALFQDQLQIEPGESLDHLIQRSKRHGAHCMARVLKQIESQTQTVVALDQTAGSYFTFPSLSQIREFRRRGYRAL